MDLSGQWASVWLRRYLVLGVAVLVAALVFGVRATVPPTFSATATMRIDGAVEGGSSASDTVTLQTQTVVGLGSTTAVAADAVSHTGLLLEPGEAASRITVTPAENLGFVAVEATGPTSTEAAALADAVAQAIQDRLVVDGQAQLAAATADLRREIARTEQELAAGATEATRPALEQRYTVQNEALAEVARRPRLGLLVVEPARTATALIGPTPWRDALLAFLVALVVAAEAVVITRAARGRLSESDTAGDARRLLGVPAVELNQFGETEVTLAPLLRDGLRSARAVTVVQVAADTELSVGAAVARAAAVVGDPAVLVEIDPRVRSSASPSTELAGVLARRLPVEVLPPVGRAGVTFTTWTGGRSDPAAAHSGREDVRRLVESDDSRIVVAVTRPALDPTLLGIVRSGPRTVVLAVDTSSTSRRRLKRDVAALRSVGAEVAAVLVWRGRFPRPRKRRFRWANPRPVGVR